MLKVILGQEQVERILGYKPNIIFSASRYFDVYHKQEWFNDDLVKQIVHEIDNADILAPDVLQDRVTKHTFAAEHLSSGSKYLIMVYKRNDLLYKATMGDNCCDLFERVVAALEKNGQDVLMLANYLYYFNFKYIKEIKYLNWDITCHSKKEISRYISDPFMDQEIEPPDDELTDEDIAVLDEKFKELGF